MDEENVIEMMGERWKPIKDYEDYLISESGKVYSKKTKKILKTTKSGFIKNKPYFDVCLCKNGISKRFKVHRLVMIHFVSDPPFEGAVCRHIDNNPSNNHYTNLQWGSNQDNYNDRLENKDDLFVYVTEQDIINIKTDLLNGLSHKEIRNKYNIKQTLVQRISSNNAWKTIGPDMSKFNYIEKQKEMNKKPEIDIKQFTQDYKKYNTNYVMKKYNLTKNQVTHILRSNNISKKPLPEIDDKTLELLISDYFDHDIEFVIDKYKYCKLDILRLLRSKGIKKKDNLELTDELKQMFDDYNNCGTKFVAEKYKKSEGYIRFLLRKYNISKPFKKSLEELQPIFDDYQTCSLTELSKKYGMSKCSIQHYLDDYHIRKGRRKRKTLDELQPMFDDYIKHGLKYVVENYNMSKSTILKYLHLYNIKRNNQQQVK